ncbi:hypothetical protein [Pararcticibacter amylolyticus]|uniref:Glycosyl transferase n=1 Tax=Pararcticibacter amylolyticus TaxID=2173175 RepID=A0A2U2PLX1_9SPHI|nr:hypothetical protein [Pararcticibacter amylolyticus]PWG82179.1 hypothetical protein DDR33_03970 [Pararcticibacter amylolyticus]
MVNIVYLAYGREEEYRRAVFSALSFLFFHGSSEHFRLIIATDNQEYFDRFLKGADVEYFLLSQFDLTEMVDESGYIHRRKICVLDKIAHVYPERDIFYLDSDTFFVKNSLDVLKKLNAGTSIMHVREYSLGEVQQIYKKFMGDKFENALQYPERFLKLISKTIFEIEGEKISFNLTHQVWNSGTVGISKSNLHLLKGILSLSDIFFPSTGWFISEQIAFSLLLQEKTRLAPFSNYLVHYYGCKARVDHLVREILTPEFAERAIAEKVKSIGSLLPALKKIVSHDQFFSISANAFKRRKIYKGASFLIKALLNIPLSRLFWSYLGLRSAELKAALRAH